jgi:hypothetical protein
MIFEGAPRLETVIDYGLTFKNRMLKEKKIWTKK